MNKSKKSIKKIEDVYAGFSGHPATLWLRGVLQSLDVEFNPTVGIKISVGQFLERFLFTQADVIAQRRTEKSIIDLNNKLKKIKLNQSGLRNNVEEFSKLFLRFYGMTGSSSYQELRKAYTNQMASFLDIRYSKEKNRLFYQQLLFKLTIDHLHVLLFGNKYLGVDKGKRYENSKKLREAIIIEFTKKGLDEALIYGLIRDLDSAGLMNSTQSSLWGGDLHQLFITDLGTKLLDQLEEKKEKVGA